MATFSVDGVFDFDELLNAGAIPSEVMNQMLHSSADVIVKNQKQTAEAMLKGKYATGRLAKSIAKGRVKRSKDGSSIEIGFKSGRVRGKNGPRTTSNAEIAFLNEYGKRGQPPRPFIQQANEKCRDAAIDAAAKVYDKWLESKGF